MQDSVHSGIAIPGFSPLRKYCSSFCELGGGSHVELGRRYLQELGLSPAIFAPSYDAYYDNNYAHAEFRGQSAPGKPLPIMMRPSFASKHVLRAALDNEAVDGSGRVFWSKTLKWGYHGTPPRNLRSILASGLRPSTAGALGQGFYFTPSPLYAQLYSSRVHGSPAKWRADGLDYFVDTMLQIRYPDMANYGPDLEEIKATVGAEYSLHRLFASAKTTPPIEDQMICRMAPHVNKVFVQAIIVKLHRQDPYLAGGEWARLKELTAQMS